MRFLNDPLKSLAKVAVPVVSAAAAVVSTVGALKQGKADAAAISGNASLRSDAAEANADIVLSNAAVEAKAIEDQVAQEQIATARDRRDLGVERARTLASTRAAFAAFGGDLSSGTEAAVLQGTASEFALRDTRMAQDLTSTVGSLRQRAAAVVDLAGKQAAAVRKGAALDLSLSNDLSGSVRSASRVNAAGSLLTGIGNAIRLK